MTVRRKPTDAELAILRVLWSRGPSTVRDVAVEMGREGSYTTVLKLLRSWRTKACARDEASRSHVYEAVASEDDTQRQLSATSSTASSMCRRKAGTACPRRWQGHARRTYRDSQDSEQAGQQ
jgi:predicted transcriptional regulator